MTTMDYDYLEPIWYQTKLCHDYEECYVELMEAFKEAIEGNLVYVRVYPEVNYEKRFEYNDTVYRGFFRIMVKKLDFDKDTISIPSIGSAMPLERTEKPADAFK